MTRVQTIHREAHMLEGPYSEEETELLRAAFYYIGVGLGVYPRPRTLQDRAANAYAARLAEHV